MSGTYIVYWGHCDNNLITSYIEWSEQCTVNDLFKAIMWGTGRLTPLSHEWISSQSDALIMASQIFWKFSQGANNTEAWTTSPGACFAELVRNIFVINSYFRRLFQTPCRDARFDCIALWYSASVYFIFKRQFRKEHWKILKSWKGNLWNSPQDVCLLV